MSNGIRIPWRLQKLGERVHLARPRWGGGALTLDVSQGPATGVLFALGDIALPAAADGPDVLLSVAPELAAADLCVANLESALVPPDRATGTDSSRLRAPPESAAMLRRAGIGVVTVANNHCLDFGGAGLAASLRALSDAGIVAVGAGADPAAARAPAIVEAGGASVGCLGYCDDFRPEVGAAPACVPADVRDEEILADIRALRPRVDVVLVQLHWGYEFQLHPFLSHRDRARRFASAGADLVLCHHAHVPMGVEVRGRSVIAHGLGNFAFRRSAYLAEGHPYTDRSYALEVRFGRAGVRSARVRPTVLDDRGCVRFARGLRAAHLRAVIARLSRRLDEDRLLQAIETDRTAREGVRCVETILDEAARGASSLRERVRALRRPRQRELGERLAAWPGGEEIARRFDRWMESEGGGGANLAATILEDDGPALRSALEAVRSRADIASLPLGRVP